ncbi:MAG: hypothetical protein JW769_00620 [Parachlamydiales bacterium]|nr:hypothetical protein [Parachlamydiales bacterium]
MSFLPINFEEVKNLPQRSFPRSSSSDHFQETLCSIISRSSAAQAQDGYTYHMPQRRMSRSLSATNIHGRDSSFFSDFLVREERLPALRLPALIRSPGQWNVRNFFMKNFHC